jgi:two-component system response regulator DesR
MRILIADDSALVRRGVKVLLSSEKDFEICGEVENGSDCVQRARELRPDVILLDISMPGLNGLQAAALLRREIPAIKIVILSQHEPAVLEASARAAGADACVDKSHLAAQLAPKIRALWASQ